MNDTIIEIRLKETEKNNKKVEVFLWGFLVNPNSDDAIKDVSKYFKDWDKLFNFLSEYFEKRKYVKRKEMM